MSLRSWDDFQWSESSIEKIILLSRYFEFPRDLFLEDDEQISSVTRIATDEVKAFKEDLSIFLLQNTRNNLAEFKSRLCFGIPVLDSILGNGLPSNTIIELSGLAGTGKTQVCIKFVTNILKTDIEAKVLFICTQERFPIERLISMLGPELNNTELDRVHLEYFLDAEVELHFFQYSIHEMMREYRYKLIVFDGIASNSRNIQDIFEKSKHINQIFASFRRLFLYYNFYSIITNQITDIPSESKPIKVSALGPTLENNINLKLYLEKTKNPEERCLSVKKSLFTPLSKGYFIISNEGIKGSVSEVS